MSTNKSPGQSARTLTIGKLARAAGVNVETIRYYQRIGLVEEPAKPLQGYRRYPASSADRIRFIKRGQELGFSLKEITDLLSLNDGDCDEVRTIAEHKHRVIQQRIDDLNAIQRELTELITACKNNSSEKDHCAIIAALTRTQQER